MLLAGEHASLGTLREQLRHGEVSEREFTGGGFFVHFGVPAGLPRLSQESPFTISDVGGRVSGIDVGFVLFVRDGKIDFLDCYTLSDGEIPQAWQLEELHYLRRDPPGSGSFVQTDDRDMSALELGTEANKV